MGKIVSNIRQSGFTIVELIVVIVVIAILATITLVGYNSVRDRAKAAAIVNEIKDIEKSFNLMAADQFVTTWWADNTFASSNSPNFKTIIANTNTSYPNAALFRKYIPEAPSVSGMSLQWVYRNNNDTIANPSLCPIAAGLKAISLYVQPIDTRMATLIDKNMDDGDLKCGRIRTYSAGILYQLSFDQKI